MKTRMRFGRSVIRALTLTLVLFVLGRGEAASPDAQATITHFGYDYNTRLRIPEAVLDEYVWATRELMRRIYTIVKTWKPDGQVNVHNKEVSGGRMP